MNVPNKNVVTNSVYGSYNQINTNNSNIVKSAIPSNVGSNFINSQINNPSNVSTNVNGVNSQVINSNINTSPTNVLKNPQDTIVNNQNMRYNIINNSSQG